MISPVLLWNRAQQQQQQQDDGCREDAMAHLLQWLPALEAHRLLSSGDCSDAKGGGNHKQKDRKGVLVHAMHHRSLYLQYARQLSQVSDAHDCYRLMMWCYDQHIFIHSAVSMQRRPSPYRDHIFTVSQDVDRLTPLLAIPEALIIGFKDVNDVEDEGNSLRDERREEEFNMLNSGGQQSDADICRFFFASLGMIVADLVTAKSSPLTDPRSVFAELLGKMRSLKNAPYFEDDVVLDADTTSLADVLLQMIRNYINGGPLVGKLDRTELQWAVSVCLSHSTPLAIASTCSIGIIPLVHLFPHGGKDTNTFLVARTSSPTSTERIAAYFKIKHGFDFMQERGGRWIYVVPSRSLRVGEEIKLQAMAPVCQKDSEAEKMWRLSCAAFPEDYMTSSEIAQMQQCLTRELIDKGGSMLVERAHSTG